MANADKWRSLRGQGAAPLDRRGLLRRLRQPSAPSGWSPQQPPKLPRAAASNFVVVVATVAAASASAEAVAVAGSGTGAIVVANSCSCCLAAGDAARVASILRDRGDTSACPLRLRKVSNYRPVPFCVVGNFLSHDL